MSQRVHRQQWRIASLVAKVVLKLTTCQFRTRIRLCSDEARLLAILDVVTHEWESDTAEVGSTTEASNHHVWIFTCHLHLLLSLKADDRLMQRYMA